MSTFKNAKKNAELNEVAPIVAYSPEVQAAAQQNNPDEATIVASSTLKKQRELKQADDGRVFVACSLPNGITFTGLRSTRTGAYTFPGVNKEATGGVLTAPGGSVLVKTPNAVWQEIKTRYQSASVFSGEQPMLREFKNSNEFDNVHDELAQVRTGMEQLDNTKQD